MRILDVHIGDHQPVTLFSDDDLPEIRVKYLTIKTNTEEARKQFHDEFINKQVFHQLDSNSHVADPNNKLWNFRKGTERNSFGMLPRTSDQV